MFMFTSNEISTNVITFSAIKYDQSAIKERKKNLAARKKGKFNGIRITSRAWDVNMFTHFRSIYLQLLLLVRSKEMAKSKKTEANKIPNALKEGEKWKTISINHFTKTFPSFLFLFCRLALLTFSNFLYAFFALCQVCTVVFRRHYVCVLWFSARQEPTKKNQRKKRSEASAYNNKNNNNNNNK